MSTPKRLRKVPRAKRGEVAGWLIAIAAAPPTDECIPFPFQQGRRWPNIRLDGTNETLGSAMLELTGRPRPPGEVACHDPAICNDGRCANPRHVRWDTVAANVRDQQIAGTAFAPTGERNGKAKLTNKQAAEIKRALALPAHCRPSQADLADRYHISCCAVSSINTGRTWAHLPPFVIPA